MTDPQVEAARLAEAIDQLVKHQRQLDMDGITVGVSREALDIVLAALSGTAPMDGWLYIASAPTEEGASFLVLRPALDSPPIIEQVSRFEGRLYPDALEGDIDWGDGIETATHWRPLPPAPKDKP